ARRRTDELVRNRVVRGAGGRSPLRGRRAGGRRGRSWRAPTRGMARRWGVSDGMGRGDLRRRLAEANSAYFRNGLVLKIRQPTSGGDVLKGCLPPQARSKSPEPRPESRTPSLWRSGSPPFERPRALLATVARRRQGCGGSQRGSGETRARFQPPSG